MSTFRDEAILIQLTTKTSESRFPYMKVDLSEQDCHLYGHSWQAIGTAGAKCCTVCGITGYCPSCTPKPPKGAHPFYCTKHTLGQNHEGVQA